MVLSMTDYFTSCHCLVHVFSVFICGKKDDVGTHVSAFIVTVGSVLSHHRVLFSPALQFGKPVQNYRVLFAPRMGLNLNGTYGECGSVLLPSVGAYLTQCDPM